MARDDRRRNTGLSSAIAARLVVFTSACCLYPSCYVASLLMIIRNQLVLFCAVVFLTGSLLSAQTKLAQTPPMGWNSWNAFHLDITDAIIRAQAAALVSTGMKDAGYEYVVID